MSKAGKPKEKSESKDFCCSLCQKAEFKETVSLFYWHTQTSPFPYLLGFTGRPPFEFYAEKIILASSDRKFLLRILKNTLSGEHQAYLLHEESHKYQYTFITFEHSWKEFLTDCQGQARLDRIDMELYPIKASVCPPCAIFQMPSFLNSARRLFPSYANENWKNSSLVMELFREQTPLTLKIQVEKPEVESELKRIVLILSNQEKLIAVPTKELALFELPEKVIPVQANLYE